MSLAAVRASHRGSFSGAAGGGGGGGGSATPAAHAATTLSSQGPSFDMALPSGVVAGSLMIARIVTNDGQPVVPSGWTSLAAATRARLMYRFATGAESSPVTVTFSSNSRCEARVTRYTGHHASAAPESSSTASGVSTSPNPGLVTPSWGTAATAWEVIARMGGSVTVNSYPADYSSGTTDGTGGLRLAVAYRSFEASSQNPGAFTISSSTDWDAYTIAIRPA